MKRCPKCKEKHIKQGVFCSRACANSRVFSEESRLKKSQALLGKPSKLVGVTLSTEARKRISEGHQRRAQENLKRPWDELSPKQKHTIIWKEQGNKCTQCGFSHTDPETGRGPFEIHHKDGNHENNEKKNLTVLCLNCHWKTPNFRFRGRKHTEEAIVKIREARKRQNSPFV